MTAAVLDAQGPVAGEDLREAARRWPGSLRECQRVDPSVYRDRLRITQDALSQPACDHRTWWRRGHGAICLWSELHELHRDVLAWRAARPGADSRDLPGFLQALTQIAPQRRAAWPSPEVLGGLGESRVGARLGRAWLARRVGMVPAALDACLLGPAGPRTGARRADR